MRRVSFEIPEGALDALCDALLIALPHGLRNIDAGGGRRRIEAVGLAGELPDRAAFEAAVGEALTAYSEEEAPADAALRRAAFSGGVRIGDRLIVRAPHDPPPDDPELIDVVIERSHGAFGTGTHPTTRMCLELLLELPPGGGLGDLGCGLGVLGIVAARLGYAPVIGVDRDEDALAVARANARRNGVEVDFAHGDLTPATVPDLETLVLNAPPSLHGVVAADLPAGTRLVIASGLPRPELEGVVEAYRAAGLVPVVRREDQVWSAAVLIRPEPADG